jgi:predicted nuclease with TOPRIM domain
MRLTDDEIQAVNYLVLKYSELWNNSEGYTRRLEELTRERDSLIQEIERMSSEMDVAKEEERILHEKLKNRYGNFQLDMDTYEVTIIE